MGARKDRGTTFNAEGLRVHDYRSVRAVHATLPCENHRTFTFGAG